eukprot:201105-Amphidinium_carterae.1
MKPAWGYPCTLFVRARYLQQHTSCAQWLIKRVLQLGKTLRALPSFTYRSMKQQCTSAQLAKNVDGIVASEAGKRERVAKALI